jgi:hypothetical protein
MWSLCICRCSFIKCLSCVRELTFLLHFLETERFRLYRSKADSSDVFQRPLEKSLVCHKPRIRISLLLFRPNCDAMRKRNVNRLREFFQRVLVYDLTFQSLLVTERSNKFNPLMPELNPSSQRFLQRFFTGDFNF